MFHSQIISFVYFYSSLFKIYFWQKKQSKFQTNKISEMLPHTRKQYFQVLFVVKSVVVVLTWFGVFVLLVDSSRIRYKQCGFQGPCYLAFALFLPKFLFSYCLPNWPKVCLLRGNLNWILLERSGLGEGKKEHVDAKHITIITLFWCAVKLI